MDWSISGKNRICGVHFRDYRADTDISAYNNAERLVSFDLPGKRSLEEVDGNGH